MSVLRINWPDIIRDFRISCGLKQEAAAHMLGVSQATLSRWECGATTPPVAVQNRLFRLLCRMRSPLNTMDWIETFRRLPVPGYVATEKYNLTAVTGTLAERLHIPQAQLENCCMKEIFWGEPLELVQAVRKEPTFSGGVVRYEGCWHVRINPDVRKNIEYFSHYICWPHFDESGNIVVVGQGRIGIDRNEAREIRARLGGPIRFTYSF